MAFQHTNQNDSVHVEDAKTFVFQQNVFTIGGTYR